MAAKRQYHPRVPVEDKGVRVPGLVKRGSSYQQLVYPPSHPNGKFVTLKAKEHDAAVAESRTYKATPTTELIAPSQITMTQLWEKVSRERLALDPSDDDYWSQGYYDKVQECRWRITIEPAIGRKKVQAVTAEDIDALFARMKDAAWEKRGKGGKVLSTGVGYSASARTQTRRLLSVLFKEALYARIRNTNPLDQARLPKAKTKGPTPQDKILLWETDVDAIFGKLLARQGGKCSPRVVARDYLVIYLLATTGMRISEILGLIWGDIDLDAGTVLLRQQLTYGLKASDEPIAEQMRSDLKWDKQEQEPKTRWLPLSEEAVRLLRSLQKDEIKEERFPRADRLVFSTSTFNALSARNLMDTLKEAAQAAKLTKPVHPHALRHAYATWLYNTGTPMEEIQELLGHASIETTKNYVTKLKDEASLDRKRTALKRAGIR